MHAKAQCVDDVKNAACCRATHVDGRHTHVLQPHRPCIVISSTPTVTHSAFVEERTKREVLARAGRSVPDA